MSDGMSGFLSALGVAVLCRPARHGLHSLLAPQDVVVPPNTAAASPSATETPADPTDGTGGVDVNAASAAAQADLSNLGTQFSMYYAVWMEGIRAGPHPLGGSYLLNGQNIGRGLGRRGDHGTIREGASGLVRPG